jgi:hypothetical protein
MNRQPKPKRKRNEPSGQMVRDDTLHLSSSRQRLPYSARDPTRQLNPSPCRSNLWLEEEGETVCPSIYRDEWKRENCETDEHGRIVDPLGIQDENLPLYAIKLRTGGVLRCHDIRNLRSLIQTAITNQNVDETGLIVKEPFTNYRFSLKQLRRIKQIAHERGIEIPNVEEEKVDDGQDEDFDLRFEGEGGWYSIVGSEIPSTATVYPPYFQLPNGSPYTVVLTDDADDRPVFAMINFRGIMHPPQTLIQWHRLQPGHYTVALYEQEGEEGIPRLSPEELQSVLNDNQGELFGLAQVDVRHFTVI